MTVFPSVWPLPYGVSIRNDFSPDHNYSIPRSQTQCWAVTLGQNTQVVINSLHNGWVGNQAWTLRAWLSIDPAGNNVLPVQYGTRRNIHLNYKGNSWNFHIANLHQDQILSADTTYIIQNDITYYFCIQNTSNEDDGYFLKFTYYGLGTPFVT